MEEQIPTKFKMPRLESYDGNINPLDHFESYKALMLIQGTIDALLCMAFPAIIKKAARA